LTSQCNIDSECAENERCVPGPNWNVCKSLEVGCSGDSDCEYGYMCNAAADPDTCAYASTCQSDSDCGTNSTCIDQGNWKECEFDWNPTICNDDRDCGTTEFCDVGLIGVGTCKSRNECDNNWDCPADFVCESNGTYRQCVDGRNCQIHADCELGYRCVPDTPRNICEYANECGADSDCGALEQCVFDGNWTRCSLSVSGVCSADSNCDDDEYCDTELGPLGTCRSRSQCFVDADCGDSGLECRSNGTWNQCMPVIEKNCWFDFQCQEGWSCNDGQCMPVYAGTCSESEGNWTVLVSTCLLVPIGTGYEFVPQNGCDGKIKLRSTGTTNGTFSQTEPGRYDITLSLVYNCTASISLGSIMTMDCPLEGCSSIQMIRGSDK